MQHRRDREHVADIVEAVTGIVRRQHLAHVDIDRQKIADRVDVFRAVQAVERRASGIGIEPLHAVALGDDGGDDGVIGRRGRPRGARGRHLAVAHLAEDFFPGLAMDVEMGKVEGREVQLPTGARAGVAAVAIDLRGLPEELLVEDRVCRGAGLAACRSAGTDPAGQRTVPASTMPTVASARVRTICHPAGAKRSIRKYTDSCAVYNQQGRPWRPRDPGVPQQAAPGFGQGEGRLYGCADASCSASCTSPGGVK